MKSRGSKPPQPPEENQMTRKKKNLAPISTDRIQGGHTSEEEIRPEGSGGGEDHTKQKESITDRTSGKRGKLSAFKKKPPP